MALSFTVLGCGSSAGVPRVAQGWGACDPANPRNRRRRCSLLVRRDGPAGVTQVLIDTTPDFREQLLEARVDSLDGILLTHAHADHTHGIDDVRPLVAHMNKRIDCYMDEPTSAEVLRSFRYIFQSPPGGAYPVLMNERRLAPGDKVRIAGAGGNIEVLPFRLDHGDIDALGFRIGGLAYTPDVVAIPIESESCLANLDVWIIDALRPSAHPTHFSLAQALEQIHRHQPRQAILTNMSTELDYSSLTQELPDGVEPAYDGMEIELPD